MIPQITNALSQGFSSSQILNFLMKKFPSHRKQIQKAISSGFSAEQILKYLSGGRKGLASDIPEMGTEHSRTRKMDIQKREDVDKGFATAAGIGAAGIGTGLAAPMAAQALRRAAPQLLGPGSILPQGSSPPQTQLPQALKQTPPLTPNIQSPVTQTPPISPSIPNASEPIQAEVKNINASEILNKHGLAKHVEEISKNVKDPKGIAAILYNKFPKEMQRLQKEAGKPMEDVVAEYMANVNPDVKQLDIEPSAIPKVEVEPLKIEKGSVAASPQGIGEVKEIRNGKAIIEVDGKKHQVDEDELISSPLPEKDLAELYEDLARGIEKETGQEISRNVEYAAYSPENNELLYKPHSGGFYVYDDIDPEVADELVNLLTERRSTGQNHIGAWVKGTASPIGSRMYDLIKKLQSERGGKGNEYRTKYQTIYGALEPAQEAKKRAYEERKKKAKKPRLD